MLLTQGGGRLTAKANVNVDSEAYRLTATAQHFPVGHFVKDLPIGPFTGKLQASGVGFDPTGVRARLKADAAINQLTYDKYDLSGLQFDANLRNGQARATFQTGKNDWVTADGEIKAQISRKGYAVQLLANIEELDLYKLGVTADTLWVGTNIDIAARANRNFTAFDVEGGIRNNRFITERISSCLLYTSPSPRD